jgi:hypothetical protein
MRDNTSRYYCGIALNKAGLHYHKTAFDSRLFEGKVATATPPDCEVNSLIPASWSTRKSVATMAARHELSRETCHDAGSLSLTGDSKSDVEA